jgi:hypothetical protein
MGITTREFGPNAKGSRLTTAEMDENFNYLNSKPYKVYTALLTQSGGDNEQIISSGPVTQGVTYSVIDNEVPGSNWDFSNVGGPVYPATGYFVAINSEIPNNYDSATVNYNAGAPVVTVLENTIGNVWFTYYDLGDYLANLPNAFPYDKTTVFMQGQSFIQVANNLNYIEIVTYDSNDVPSDGLLSNTPIEIRVYN